MGATAGVTTRRRRTRAIVGAVCARGAGAGIAAHRGAVLVAEAREDAEGCGRRGEVAAVQHMHAQLVHGCVARGVLLPAFKTGLCSSHHHIWTTSEAHLACVVPALKRPAVGRH